MKTVQRHSTNVTNVLHVSTLCKMYWSSLMNRICHANFDIYKNVMAEKPVIQTFSCI